MDEIPPEPDPTTREPLPPLNLIDPAGWADTDAPERHWKVQDYIPDRQATLLTGKGAAGKSLVSQQQCTCVAMGLPFLGIETMQAPALYVTCEDDADELHRRQKAICEALNVPLAHLSGRLHLLSLQGEMGNELATFDQDGRMRTAPRFEQIVEACRELGIRFLVLDNTAHLFTGNENDRHQVAAFINLCNRLAIAIDGAVVIVGHPNKAGDSYSGSTAWENQVRSRLFMEIPVNDAGVPENPDYRVMRREKANYAQRGGDLEFMWHKGAFVLRDALPEEDRRTIAQVTQDAEENARFMRCLAAATAKKRAVSHIKGINYFGSIFARMPEAGGMKLRAFEAAFERVLHLGWIELDAQLWRDASYHWKVGIRAISDPVTPKSGNPPVTHGDHTPKSQEYNGNAVRQPPVTSGPVTPPVTPSGDPRRPHAQVIENKQTGVRPATPLYPTDITDGAGFEAGPPDWMDEAPWPEPEPDLVPDREPDLDWMDNPVLNRDFGKGDE
jgi:RecA-family ATPase